MVLKDVLRTLDLNTPISVKRETPEGTHHDLRCAKNFLYDGTYKYHGSEIKEMYLQTFRLVIVIEQREGER